MWRGKKWSKHLYLIINEYYHSSEADRMVMVIDEETAANDDADADADDDGDNGSVCA